jgi:hypothetical protein
MSMPRIAFLLRVSAQAVLTWIRNLAKDYDEMMWLYSSGHTETQNSHSQ